MAVPHATLLDIACRPDSIRPIEAAGLVQSAFDHRMDGLLYSFAIADRLPSLLSKSDMRVLAAATLDVEARQARQAATLAEISERLAPVEVRPVVIKGLPTQARWYDQPGERPSTDVDIVLDVTGERAISETLEVLGLEPRRACQAGALVARKRLQSVGHAYSGVAIDIHFDHLKLGMWTRNRDAFFRSAEAVQLPNGQSVLAPDPEHALLLFLVHMNKDRFSLLLSFVDVLRIIDREQIDWARFDELVRADGLEVPAYRSLAAVLSVAGRTHPNRETGRGSPRSLLWTASWPERSRLRGRHGRATRKRRQTLIPFLASGRLAEALTEVRRQYAPPRDLVDFAGTTPQSHSYVRRITLDRIRNT